MINKTNVVWEGMKFRDLLPDQFVPAIKSLTEELKTKITALIEEDDVSWVNFVDVLSKAERDLSCFWERISLMDMVNGNATVKKAYSEAQKVMIDYENWFMHNQGLYHLFKNTLKQDLTLDDVQKRILERIIQDFELSGIALEIDQQKNLDRVVMKLAKLSNKFANNLVAATAQCKLEVPACLAKGLPNYFINSCRSPKNKNVLIFPMDDPHYVKIITYAENRKLRKTAYFKYQHKNSISSIKNPLHVFNNFSNIVQILNLRNSLSNLLSFPNYAAYALVNRMTKTLENSLTFLKQLLEKSRVAAEKEFKTLQEFTQFQHVKVIEPWDFNYFKEKLKKTIFDFNEEDLRPYFPLEHVLDGLFKLVERLFKVKVVEVFEQVDKWHPTVRYFEVWDHGELVGHFYLDLFVRNYKQAGAWVGELQGRNHRRGLRDNPIVYLVCNFLPSTGNMPVLLTHGEVITLLHEFGHVLQHVLTKVEYPNAAGTNGIPWDAVEVVSQFMENFAWIPEGLTYLSKHYQTGEPLPNKLLEKINQNRNFMAANAMLRQLEFALVDLILHSKTWNSKQEILSAVEEVQKVTRLIPVNKKFSMLPSFAHIFAGGYAAGYYSYKWAEVLSCDLFARFMEEGIFNNKVGEDFYRCFLITGGSEDPKVLFQYFRGREPTIDALLKMNNVLE